MSSLPIPSQHPSSIDFAAQRILRLLQREERRKARVRQRLDTPALAANLEVIAASRPAAATSASPRRADQPLVGLLDLLASPEYPAAPGGQLVAENGQPGPEPCRLKSDAYTDSNLVPRICIYNCPGEKEPRVVVNHAYPRPCPQTWYPDFMPEWPQFAPEEPRPWWKRLPPPVIGPAPGFGGGGGFKPRSKGPFDLRPDSIY